MVVAKKIKSLIKRMTTIILKTGRKFVVSLSLFYKL